MFSVATISNTAPETSKQKNKTFSDPEIGQK
jgi:hypothetical protein